MGPGVELFQYLADCVGDFLRTEGMEDAALPLGNLFRYLLVYAEMKSEHFVNAPKYIFLWVLIEFFFSFV